jgi:hypothetical protein
MIARLNGATSASPKTGYNIFMGGTHLSQPEKFRPAGGNLPSEKRTSPRKTNSYQEIPPSCSDKSTSIQYTGIVQGTNHDDLPRVVLAMIYVWIAQFAQPSTRS